jgi:D-arabinose 1-dehydrogenase-like Zn-dependent alcohol dehydrogenase
MICVVVLQNCMYCVEGETVYCSETCVTFDVDGTKEVSIKVEAVGDMKEEVSIKVEEAGDIKDEIREAVTVPSIKTEHEVRLWGVCEEVATHACRPIIAPNTKL